MSSHNIHLISSLLISISRMISHGMIFQSCMRPYIYNIHVHSCHTTTIMSHVWQSAACSLFLCSLPFCCWTDERGPPLYSLFLWFAHLVACTRAGDASPISSIMSLSVNFS